MAYKQSTLLHEFLAFPGILSLALEISSKNSLKGF